MSVARPALAAFVFVGCGALQHRGPAAPLSVTLDPVNSEHMLGPDRVSAGDAPSPDGHPDVELTAHVRGRFSTLILNLCDDPQNPSGTQWDTIIGQDPMPTGYPFRFGYETWVLGVFDTTGRRLNRPNGALPEQDYQQVTTLKLYAAPRDNFVGGRSICLTAIGANGTAVTSMTDVR